MSDEKPLRDRVTSPTINVSRVVGTAIRLGIASLIVGVLLAVLRINPIEMWRSLWKWTQNGLVDLVGTGIEGIGLVVTLVVTGAIVVVPLWFIGKLLSNKRD